MQYSLLNLLRFLAAFWVVLHHFAWNIPPFNEGFLNSFIKNGHLAVTFFFVLSGFVMVLSNERKDFSEKSEKIRFWKKRAIRLLPLYYIGLGLFTLFFLIIKSPVNWGEFTQNILGVQAWNNSYSPELNPPAWSLSVEFHFYLLTPFILLFGHKKKLSFLITVTSIIWITTLAGFLLMTNLNEGEKITFNFLPFWHIGTFLTGIITGKIWLKKKDQIRFQSKDGTLLIILILTFLCVFNTTYFHGKHINLLAPLFGFFIYLIVLLEQSIGPIRINKTFNFLGDLSYPIYILHWPFIKYFHYYVSDENTIMWLVQYSLSLLLFCIIIHLTIERFFKKIYQKI